MEVEKKRRGRPKKNVAEPVVVNDVKENIPQEVKQDTPKQEIPKQEEVTAKRRGRPKKALEKKISGKENILVENTNLEKEENKEKNKQNTSKRGRKPKKSKDNSIEKTSSQAHTRGRKRGSLSKKDNQAPLALEESKRLSLEVGVNKALISHDLSATLPSEIGSKEIVAVGKKEIVAMGNKDIVAVGKKDIVAYEAGVLATVEKKQETIEQPTVIIEKTEAPKKEFKPRKRGRKKKNKESADFVAGTNGVAPYLGEETLSSAGEQAGLGVLGVISEAPIPDAVIPLVTETEKNVKKTRKRGRKKKAKTQENVLASDFESSPIVEDGELARIEAEENIRQNTKAKNKQAKAESTETKEKIHRVLYVSTVPDEQVEVVITENGIVSEYFVEMVHQSKIRGNIYKGVINNVDTNLQAAFVNFGCGKNGFLQIDEVHPDYWLTPFDESQGKYPPIQKVLKVGQEVLVQVVKEPNGSKGAFLTTWISLAGRFIVLTPGQEQIGVSRKVEDNEERQRLRALLSGIKPGENMGVIIRTASEGASKTHIQKDLQVLKRTWKNVQKQVQKLPAPSLVYQEADLSSRAVRDYLNEDIHEIWVDSKDVEKSVRDLMKIVFPKSNDILHLHEDTRISLWERFNITRQLEEVTKREVNLPSGGRLVFDQTEALLAIDINSGKSQGKTNFEAMVYRTNMEAVEAIARHLRLRDIGGQIVIDFIEMRDKNHCREIEKALHEAMKRDRARHDIGKLSSFGLLELVRQRTGSSVISISSEPCPHCRGTGFRRNLEWQAQAILREIKSKLAGKNVPSTYVHHVEQEIAFYLLNKKRDRLSELEQEYQTKIEIHLK